MLRDSQGFAADAPMLQDISVDDSSEDEAPQPMKFSALTNALLANDDTREYPRHDDHYQDVVVALNAKRDGTPSQLRITRAVSPANLQRSQSPRVVRVSSKAFDPQQRSGSPEVPGVQPSYHYVTPAPSTRAIRVNKSRSGSNSSLGRSGGTSAGRLGSTDGRLIHQIDAAEDFHTLEHAATATRTFSSRQNIAPASSMRVKRVQIGASSFLRGAPVRRGMKHNDEPSMSLNEENLKQVSDAYDTDVGHDTRHDTRPEPEVAASSPFQEHAPVEQPARSRQPSITDRADSVLATRANNDKPLPTRPRAASQVKISVYQKNDDQENMPPPMFKRKDHAQDTNQDKLESKLLRGMADTPVRASKHISPRKVLGVLSENTPRRQAPPPPKMSVSDAATKAAGADTIKSRKRRQHVVINGKTFSQLKKLGTGGSAVVYCVMAENGKMFAVKRVKLGGDLNDTAIAGFLGEVDLLLKLKDSTRVVRLLDHEMDNAKHTLSLLMEMGDHDLQTFVASVKSAPDAKLDTVMVRHYWKEMLECVQSVHEYDIVHSDLKPANFLSVCGRLKLIDFGIANAINIEHTVNIHRDSPIGTPNYMSPESLTDTNAPRPGMERSTIDPKTGRVMKLGKASDVWSLGCVLYQLVYGAPPFAYIPNQLNRVMAITDPKIEISYPIEGLGGVSVPPSLLNTLKRCLQRDQHLRPTVDELLKSDDAFLYPEANGVVMTEEILARIIGNVVQRCEKGIPSKAELDRYPATFMEKVRGMVIAAGVGTLGG